MFSVVVPLEETGKKQMRVKTSKILLSEERPEKIPVISIPINLMNEL